MQISPVSEFMTWWIDRFQKEYGRKCFPTQKDFGIAKRLLRLYPYEELVEYADNFWENMDYLWNDCSPSLAVFEMLIPKIIKQMSFDGLIKESPVDEGT